MIQPRRLAIVGLSVNSTISCFCTNLHVACKPGALCTPRRVCSREGGTKQRMAGEQECSPEIHPKRSNKEEVPLRRFPLVPKVSLLVPVGAVCQCIQLPHHEVLQQT